MRGGENDRERGAVLLMTLLVMSLMAGLAVAMMDMTRVSIKRTANIASATQADWYAKGVEDFAQVFIEQKLSEIAANDGVLRWHTEEPMLFPIEGGHIKMSVQDGTNCLSLGRLSNAIGQMQFNSLLLSLNWSPNETDRFVNLATDWVDADSRVLPSGAEDYVYLGQVGLPHRTANTRFFSVMELRSLPGMSSPLYQSLRRFVCARPLGKVSPININSVDAWQAPVLAAVLGSSDYLEIAQRVIAERPASGYASIDDMLGLPFMPEAGLEGLDLQSLTTQSRHVWVEADIKYFDAHRVVILDYSLETGALTRDYRARNDEARRLWNKSINE